MGERLGINVVGATELPRAAARRDPDRDVRATDRDGARRGRNRRHGGVPLPGARAPDASRRPARVAPARLESHDAGGARAAAGQGPRHHAARRRRLRRRHLADLLRRRRPGSRRRRRHRLHPPRPGRAGFYVFAVVRRPLGTDHVDGRRRLRAAARRLSPRMGKRVGEPRLGATAASHPRRPDRLPAPRHRGRAVLPVGLSPG